MDYVSGSSGSERLIEPDEYCGASRGGSGQALRVQCRSQMCQNLSVSGRKLKPTGTLGHTPENRELRCRGRVGQSEQRALAR